jgi:phage replication O-like protein O
MANPQTENGYTKIANEILEKIACTDFLGSEFRILNCIIRKTYGFHKKDDVISLTQFEKATGLSRPTVVSVIKNLIENKVIIKIKNRFSLNKNWEEWGSKGVLIRTSKHEFTASKAGLTSKARLTATSKARLTATSKARLTHKRKKEKKDISGKNPQALSVKEKIMKNYNENNHTDSNDRVIDYETGQPIEKKEVGRQKAINYIKTYFADQCEKYTKIRPIMGKKENIIIANLFNKKFKPDMLTEIIDWWFNTERDRTKAIHLSICFSNYSLNMYKIK